MPYLRQPPALLTRHPIILDFSQLAPGSFCSKYLLDSGATVIKIERPDTGDGARHTANTDGRVGHIFDALNSGKRSIALNLKTSEGQALAHQLIARADVVIENYLPGTTERLGIDYAASRTLNPTIIYCSITGYGQHSERSSQPGHDINFMAESGATRFLAQSPHPSPTPLPISDIVGGLMAATDITYALAEQHRSVSPRSRYIDISLTGCMEYALTNTGLLECDTSIAAPAYDYYRTKDSQYLAVGAEETQFWNTFSDLIGLPDLKQYDPLDTTLTGDQVRDRIQLMISQYTAEELEQKLKSQRIPANIVKTLAETPRQLDAPPVTHDRNSRTHSAQSHHRTTHKNPTQSQRDRNHGPRLGEHTMDALTELGLTHNDINTFRTNGIIDFPSSRDT